MRDTFLRNALRDFLDRRSIPIHLRDKDDARKKEMAALLGKVISLAPKVGYDDWFVSLANALDDMATHRTWPTVNEIRGAARLVAKNRSPQAGEIAEFSTVDVMLSRLRNKEPLGDEWLYGSRAVELIGAGASEDDLKPYRSALFFSMKEIWGEAVALDRERDFRGKHDAALVRANKPMRFNMPPLPVKRMEAAE